MYSAENSSIHSPFKNIYFFWVIPQCLNFICRRFGTLCLHHLHRQVDVKNELGLRNVGGFIWEKVWLRLFSSQTFSCVNTPTFNKPNSFFTSTCLWRWNRKSVPKCQHIKFGRLGITRKKAYNKICILLNSTPFISNIFQLDMHSIKHTKKFKIISFNKS